MIDPGLPRVADARRIALSDLRYFFWTGAKP